MNAKQRRRYVRDHLPALQAEVASARLLDLVPASLGTRALAARTPWKLRGVRADLSYYANHGGFTTLAVSSLRGRSPRVAIVDDIWACK